MRVRPTSAALLLALAAIAAGCGDDNAPGPDLPDAADGIHAGDAGPADAPAVDVPTEPGARTFGAVASQADMPGIAAQTTERGRMIGALHSYDGRVWIGYGDFTKNTGPIAVLSYEPQSGALAADQTVSTEEVLRFATWDGALFIADSDARGHEAEGSVFRLVGAAGTWETMTPIAGAVHTFDVGVFGGRLLAATGSIKGGSAWLMSTDDGGLTWQDEHSTPTDAASFARYTHIGVDGDRLLVFGRLHGTPSQRLGFFRDPGAAWQTLGGLPGGSSFLVPLPAPGGGLLFAEMAGDMGKGGQHTQTWALEGDGLKAADGALPPDSALVAWSPGDDGRAWLLCTAIADGAAALWASAEGGWERVAELPALEQDAYSALVWHNNDVFVGTLAGDLYRVAEIRRPVAR